MANLKSVYHDKTKIYKRGLLNEHFCRTKANGSKEDRRWLVFSETSLSVYCYPCKMFSSAKTKLAIGFQNWKTIVKTLADHETSKDHILSMCTLHKRSSASNRIDSELVQQIEFEENYWRKVLRRVVSTVKFISSLGLAFRGHNESKQSDRKGNFLTCLEYLSEYDEFLKLHLQKYGHQGSGTTSYLSNTTCNEFINIISSNIKGFIVDEIKNSKYYSIILDSTPDCSHIDQMSLIVRYVLPNGDIKERFLGFFPIEHHAAQYLEEKVLSYLLNCGIDIKLCRGQTYDNAANMSGKYSGLQARIKEHSSNAVFVPCASHSLNLIGNFSAESCSIAVRFFMFIQNLFNFFSVSTHRWQILSSKLQKCEGAVTVKKLSDTRWSARADAVLALKIGYLQIKDALSEISKSSTEKKTTIIESTALLKKMESSETALMTVIWNNILQRLNATSKSLQSVECTVFNGANLLKSLESFISGMREKFSEIELEANSMVDFTLEEIYGRKRKRRVFFDESGEDFSFSNRENFIINTFYVICDSLTTELSRRSQIYGEVVENFKIFFDFSLENQEKEKYINNLKDLYKSDIDINCFNQEVEQFLLYIKDGGNNCNSITQIYTIALELISTFPNVEIILKIFLTIPVSNASGERSFSVLKRIKNYLRSTMCEDRLSSLALMYVEQEVLKDMDVSKIIDNFAAEKCRRKHI